MKYLIECGTFVSLQFKMFTQVASWMNKTREHNSSPVLRSEKVKDQNKEKINLPINYNYYHNIEKYTTFLNVKKQCKC